ncbi:MAG: formylglycine-generating enzyme family protein [Gemmataceae bacterium]|nr:formylglycine-generating enzyme family protein [Gemmataceae bacterium]
MLYFLAALLGGWPLGQEAIQAQPKPAAKDFKPFVEKLQGSNITFDMMPIPGGDFLMGSPEGENGRNADEGPQHPVTIKPFWMGKCEVTWDEYDQYWKTDDQPKDNQKDVDPKSVDAITRPTPPYADETFGHGREGQPVLCITQHAAIEYCRWLSRKTGHNYRLPTEAEWEYACRAGTKGLYSFGDDGSKLGDYAWVASNSEELTHKVGQKKPNPWGLFDMHGNVAEWCLDHYRKDVYASFPKDRATVQPVLLPSANRFSHVARGGSWADQPAGCRSAARRGSDKTWIKLDPQRPQSIWWLTSAEFVGFRVVRAVEEQENLKGLRSKVTKQSD